MTNKSVRHKSVRQVYGICCVVITMVTLGGCVEQKDSGGSYGEEQLARFATSEVSQAIVNDGDPYRTFSDPMDPRLTPQKDVVCGVKILRENPLQYRLDNYASEAAAKVDGAAVTHFSACGTCSTLKDLSVYLSYPNLTIPVRRCATIGLLKPLAMRCLESIGFTTACAETWYFNIKNTTRHCGKKCLKSWLSGEPFSNEKGELNPCLSCDEAYSGPVFKYSAGRTRRNSGITSAIQRGDGEQVRLRHEY